MKLLSTTALVGGLAVIAAATPPMNGVVVSTVFKNDAGSTFTPTVNYPASIVFDDANLGPSGANRFAWALSADAGATAYKFTPDSFFSLSWDLTLTGSPISPRKEAGFLIDDIGSGIGQSFYIVNTDAHEVVAFGGPFFAFPATYDSGELINMRWDYYLGADSRRKVRYWANGVSSGELDITNNENSLFAASGGTVGGYMQDNGSAAAVGHANANWGNIVFTPGGVPEPTTMLGMAAGLGLLMARRRRSSK